MKKLMPLLVSIVILAVASNAQDSGAESIVLMTFDDLKAGTIIPADVRFVSSGQPDEAVLEAIAAAGFSVVVDLRSASEDRASMNKRSRAAWDGICHRTDRGSI